MSRNIIKPGAFVLVFTWFSAFVVGLGGTAGFADAETESLNRQTGNPNIDKRANETRAIGGWANAQPIVIAHRGASALRPEHTLSAYEMALAQGADFIELDLVATRDGALIARHENALAMVVLDGQNRIQRGEDGLPELKEATTDVAGHPEFADRLTVKLVDGRPVGGWFSEDFTLAEIRTLRARERLPGLRPQNRLYDDQDHLPTLAEVVALVRDWEAQSASRPGLYIEIKHPTYFLEEGRTLSGEPIGLDLVGLLLDGLVASGFTESDRVFIQCFEVAPLIELSDRMAVEGLTLPLVQLFGDVHNRRYRAAPRDLVYYAGTGDLARYGRLGSLVDGGLRPGLSYAELAAPAVLAFMAERYATAIGPPRNSVMKVDLAADGRTAVFTGEMEPLLSHAHQVGLLVHPYTLRAEVPFLFQYRGASLTVGEEARILLEAGVQGFFIDQPAEGRLAVDRFTRERSPVLEAGEPL